MYVLQDIFEKAQYLALLILDAFARVPGVHQLHLIFEYLCYPAFLVFDVVRAVREQEQL